ncbi:hypothetical protein [Pseudofrankia sp. DC12]|uniref:hypothetical protein n=1 Tax=Pseudofrankia sp. DC12 TaxID=683315 RepID=UPI0005F7BC6F|nr:hypothetical protein [Pseudofrankia sp. DC12]
MTGRHEAGGPRPEGAPSPGRPPRPGHAPRPGDLPGEDLELEEERAGFGFRILPAGWMRGLLFTATAVLTVVLALSDLTSAWVLLALPASVALAVAYLETLDRITRPSTPYE